MISSFGLTVIEVALLTTLGMVSRPIHRGGDVIPKTPNDMEAVAASRKKLSKVLGRQKVSCLAVTYCLIRKTSFSEQITVTPHIRDAPPGFTKGILNHLLLRRGRVF